MYVYVVDMVTFYTASHDRDFVGAYDSLDQVRAGIERFHTAENGLIDLRFDNFSQPFLEDGRHESVARGKDIHGQDVVYFVYSCTMNQNWIV